MSSVRSSTPAADHSELFPVTTATLKDSESSSESSPKVDARRSVHRPLERSTFSILKGRLAGNLNPRIPHIKGDPLTGQFLLSCFRLNGFGKLTQRCMAEAKKAGTGAAQASLLHYYVLFLLDPVLIQQLKFNRDKLTKGETGGTQEKFLGAGTPVSLSDDDKRYPPIRHRLMMAMFNPVRKLTGDMQHLLNSYIEELFVATRTKQIVDLQDLGARIALRLICQTQLGFNHFPVEDQRALIRIVNGIVKRLPNPANASLVALENSIKHGVSTILPKSVTTRIGNLNHHLKKNLGIGLSLTPHLDRAVIEGEAIITRLVTATENRATVLAKLRILSGNPELKESELTSPEIMSWFKLILAGGFETTAKALRDAMIFLQDPKNQLFIDKIRTGLAIAEEKLNKDPGQWTMEDLQILLEVDLDHPDQPPILQYLSAFIYEVFRLNPPFSHMRTSSTESFSLAPDLTPSKNPAEYKEKFATRAHPEKDIHVPKNTLIIFSPFDAHRTESAYGKDAAEFNPERWIGKKFSLLDVMKQWNFLTFGNTLTRACPGRLFSEQELFLFLARVISQFNIKPVGTPAVYDPGFTLELASGSQALGRFEVHSEKPEVKNEADDVRPEEEPSTGLRRRVRSTYI